MEKELNIAAILEGKPSAKLWSPIIGDCTYSNYYPPTEEIIVNFTNRYGEEGEWNFHQSGRTLSAQNTAEVCLFPSKSMRDWSKFAWKKGDVLYAESIDNYCIFNKFTDDEYTTFEGKYLFDARNMDICNSNYFNESTNEFVKVSDDDAKIILSNLASLLGGKLNLSTLEIDKSEFKVLGLCLMRIKGDCWKLCQFGFKGEDKEDPGFNAVGGSWFDECIPYNDKTSHLLGTTDDYEEGGEV